MIIPSGFGNFPLSSKSENKAYGAKMTKKQAESACEHEAESIESIHKAGVKEIFGSGSEQISISTKCELD